MNNARSKTAGFTTRYYAIISLIALFSQSFACFSQQDPSPKFGTVDRRLLEMKVYEKDTAAAALYLYDYGNVTFRFDEDLGIVMVMECWLRIKILKKSALREGTVSIKYRKGDFHIGSQLIANVEGFTYNLEEGEIVSSALDTKTIKKKRLQYEEWSTDFQLPDVRVGSILEYTYTRITPIRCRDRPDTWYFQGQHPYLWSEFRMTVPRFIAYKLEFGEYLSSYERQEENVNVEMGNSQYDGPGISYRFLVKDSPSFVREPFITSSIDYLSKINFELIGFTPPTTGKIINLQSWGDFDHDFTNDYWAFRVPVSYWDLGRAAKAIYFQTQVPEERMKLAYKQVQSIVLGEQGRNLSSNTGERDSYRYWSKNGRFNIALIKLLRNLKIECEPLLLNTKPFGRVNKNVADWKNFNYVIAYAKIEGKEFFLDATQPYARLGMLPEYVSNTTGRIVPKNGVGRFIEVPGSESRRKTEVIHARIEHGNCRISGQYTVQYGGYDNLRWRNKYLPKHDSIYKADLRRQFSKWQIDDIEIWNKFDFDEKDIEANFNFQIIDTSRLKPVIYFNPILTGRYNENPFKINDRKYPLDFSSRSSNALTVDYRLPTGYEVEELPKSEVISLMGDAGQFVYKTSFKDDVLHLYTSITINKLRFLPEEYSLLKEFFDQIIKNQAQVVKIRKIHE